MNRSSRLRAAGASLVGMVVAGSVMLVGPANGSAGTEPPSSTPAETAAAGGTAAPAVEPGSPAPMPLAEPTDVVISVVSPAEYLSAIFLADAMGEFEKENLNVEIVRNDLSTGSVLLLEGSVNLAAGGLNAGLLNAVSQGDGLTQVGHINDLSPDSCEGIWVRQEFATADGVPNPDEMRGQSVNFGGGGVAHSNAGVNIQWLASGGLTLDDVSIATLGSGDSLLALEQGSIVSSYITQPFCEQAAAGDFAIHVPGTGYSFSSYMMSTDFIANNRDVAKAIIRALLRTSRTYLQGDYHQNADVVTALATAVGVTEEQFTSSSPFLFTTDLEFGESAVHWMELDQQVWLEAGDVLGYTEALPTDRFVDLSLAQEVLAGQ